MKELYFLLSEVFRDFAVEIENKFPDYEVKKTLSGIPIGENNKLFFNLKIALKNCFWSTDVLILYLGLDGELIIESGIAFLYKFLKKKHIDLTLNQLIEDLTTNFAAWLSDARYKDYLKTIENFQQKALQYKEKYGQQYFEFEKFLQFKGSII